MGAPLASNHTSGAPLSLAGKWGGGGIGPSSSARKASERREISVIALSERGHVGRAAPGHHGHDRGGEWLQQYGRGRR